MWDPWRKTKRRLMWAGLVLGILAAAGFFLFGVNRFSLEVELAGEQAVVMEFGEPYSEPGAAACLRGSLIAQSGIPLPFLEVEVLGAVDETKVGPFDLTYAADFLFWHGENSRKVTIIDSVCPEITLTEDGPAIAEGPYQEAGFYAVDNYDGNITGRVVRTEHPGYILYAVVDSSGNPAYARREIPIYDASAPVITLNGGEHMAIPAGLGFTDPGFTAVDDVDGDVSEHVVCEGEVKWYQAGTYELQYTVSDFQGNESTAIRTVEVMPLTRPEEVMPQGKTIYLTFDDGPGPYTRQLLNLLDTYGVKATFFVTDAGDPDMLREIVSRGHAIGIHTMSHDYGAIYESPEAFFEDLFGMQQVIFDATGVKTTLMRFPGGSSNTVSKKTCEGIMTTLTEAVQDMGFQYFDWNVDSDDAGGAKKARQVFANVRYGVQEQRVSVVLQHDIHGYSVEAMEDILVWAISEGYQFEKLTPNSPGFHHDVNN